MADAMSAAAVDPFAPRDVAVARLARRLHCTEGQLYSVAIGMLLTLIVSVNALPHVAWHRSGTESTSFALAPSPAPNQSPGLLSTEPSPVPVVKPAPVTTPATTNGVASPSTPSPSPSQPAPAPASPPSTPAVSVKDGGYAAATAGTPLSTVGVPDGSVAVAQQAGQPDKVTYLHLAGGGTPLELMIDTAGGNTFDSLAGLQLCIVTQADWKVGHGDTSLANAPTYDCANAIAGVRTTTGDRWTFDVTQLDVSRLGGVAIVPASDATAPSFQVVFHVGATGA